MKISLADNPKFQALSHSSFEAIKDKQFRPAHDIVGLKYLRDKAGNERNLRELYRGRGPYELLQNADDVGAKKVAYILTRDGMAFVHDGKWFTVDNFCSLADGWSDKDPSQCIGHKGLGFRSVLDITPAPHLIKVDESQYFAIKFNWALNNGHIQETFTRASAARDEYEKWTKHGRLACPIMAIPGFVKKQSLGMASKIFDDLVRKKYIHNFTTMFWFPALDPDIAPKVLEELNPIPLTSDLSCRTILQEFLSKEVSVLLPFLGSVEEVALYDGSMQLGMVSVSKVIHDHNNREIIVNSIISGARHEQAFSQMIFPFQIPHSIIQDKETPRAIKEMKEKGVKIILSVKIDEGQPSQDNNACYHVYFPTEEVTGVGFIIHGDFYVKPDRTRLMDGVYNDWLIERAAKAAANDFLTHLLSKYNPRHVFSALRTIHTTTKGKSGAFINKFSKELQNRTKPFIPTALGLKKKDEVAIPPTVDEDGFWQSHFEDVVRNVFVEKIAFLAPEEDCVDTREFLQLAKTEYLKSEAFLSFMQCHTACARTAEWWYECYSYMTEDVKLTRHDHSLFVGKEIIPIVDGSIIKVPADDSDRVVCLPPDDSGLEYQVPACFISVFAFLNPSLAKQIDKGRDVVRSWVLDRFRITRFEATDLLPRAIRSVVARIYSGEHPMGMNELIQAWIFMKYIVSLSRSILSAQFWSEVGRFPVPLSVDTHNGYMMPENLMPAFLSYWPDSFLPDRLCIKGIDDIRRVNLIFLSELIAQSKIPLNEWNDFLAKAGVSGTTKLLTYSRDIARGEDLSFEIDAPRNVATDTFSGQKQIDENLAIVDSLKRSNYWNRIVRSSKLCDHRNPKVLRKMTLLEGLDLCTKAAEMEHSASDEFWRQRLWCLINSLPFSSLNALSEDEVFCRGGSASGHSLSIGKYVSHQLNQYRWLPSTQGPKNSSECFLRRSSRRLISSGRADEELGDILLPYVVVDNVDDVARLKNLGVEELDDVDSSTPTALFRALAILGQQLSTEWGECNILRERGRWRLVRGAIQNIYRYLNQSVGDYEPPEVIKYAARIKNGLEYKAPPLYYAEPGSSIEQAFLGVLPLFDSDRPYRKLFDCIGVIRLVAGETVEETLMTEDKAQNSHILRNDIINRLAPYLLAPIIAKSDKSNQFELLVRRLRERFEVKTADHLAVSYRLKDKPDIEKSVEYPKYYLQRRLLPGSGAVQEAHYTLYTVGKPSISILDAQVDADALGEAIFPLLSDGSGDDLSGLFPRITSRFHQVRGKQDAMEEFLYYQLGISKEAQDMAWAVIRGDVPASPPIPSPPPAKVAQSSSIGEGALTSKNIGDAIKGHQNSLQDQAAGLINDLVGKQGAKTPPQGKQTHIGGKQMRITPEQEARGKRGELEIKRRLELPGGWEGYILKEDVRDQGCGFDFLCTVGTKEVKLEVKTFAPDGQVYMTSNELKEAGASEEDYYLVGVLDDGKPEYEWHTHIIQDPIAKLLTKGCFKVQATLQILAKEVFSLDENK